MNINPHLLFYIITLHLFIVKQKIYICDKIFTEVET